MTMTKPSGSFCILCVCVRGVFIVPFFHKWDLCQSKLFLPQTPPSATKKNKKTQERETFLYYFPCNSSQTSELLAFLGSHVTF